MVSFSRFTQAGLLQERPGFDRGRDHRGTMVRIVVLQLLATLVVSASCLFIHLVAAGSVLVGGLAAALPNGLVAWRFVAAGRRVDARTLAFAELGRWGVTVALLAGALLLMEVAIAPLLGMFAVMQFVPIAVPLLKRRTGAE